MGACREPSFKRLKKAEDRRDILSQAECYANLGHVDEVNRRIGDAVRHWSRALWPLTELHIDQSAEGERLIRLIRQWHRTPRVWISYAHV